MSEPRTYQTCRFCHAQILFLRMASGRAMPVEIKPVKAVIERDGKYVLDDTWTPHWGNCPGAGQARREARTKKGTRP